MKKALVFIRAASIIGPLCIMADVIISFMSGYVEMALIIIALSILQYALKTWVLPLYLTYAACGLLLQLILILIPGFDFYNLYDYLLIGGGIVFGIIAIVAKILMLATDTNNDTSDDEKGW